MLAAVGGIQTLPITIIVLLHPDSLYPLDSTHYAIDFNKANGRDTLIPLRTVLSHITALDTTGLAPYRLQYVITYPSTNTNLDSDETADREQHAASRSSSIPPWPAAHRRCSSASRCSPTRSPTPWA